MPKAEKKRFKAVLSCLLIAATLLGLTVLIPRPVLTATDPVDGDNPFSASFTLANNGIIPLTNVSVGIHPQEIVKGNATAISPPREQGDAGKIFTITEQDWNHLFLGMDQSMTIPLSTVVGPLGAIKFADTGEYRKGDLSVIVRYSPFYIPIRRTKEFHVRLRKETNGKLYWTVVLSQ